MIIAAGRGTRLNAHSKDAPKSLISIGTKSIIETILTTLRQASVSDVIIVTGYKHDILEQQLGDGSSHSMKVRYVYNEEWQKKNGVSVYAARDMFAADEKFLLMMSDHIFSDDLLQKIIAYPLNTGEVVLAVDTRIGSVFDIDDATKVQVEAGVIRTIGKELPEFNGVDCGLFKCTTGIFDALRVAMSTEGDCSLTEGGMELARRGKFKAVPIGDGWWVDIDTPEALNHAIGMMRPSKPE